MLSPFKSKWDTCILQSWIPGFNLDNPSNLTFPTWVGLRRLPFEHHDQAIDIVETLGEVIGMELSNNTAKDPRLCIILKIDNEWVTNIDFEFKDGMLPPHKVLVNYDKLPIHKVAEHAKVGNIRTVFAKKCRNIQ